MDIMWRRNRKFITVELWRRTLGEGRGEMGWIILYLVLLLAQGISSSPRFQAILGLHFEVLGFVVILTLKKEFKTTSGCSNTTTWWILESQHL